MAYVSRRDAIVPQKVPTHDQAAARWRKFLQKSIKPKNPKLKGENHANLSATDPRGDHSR